MPRFFRAFIAMLFVAASMAPSTAHAKKNVIGAEMTYAIGQDQQDMVLRYGWRWKLATALVQADIIGGTTMSSDGEVTPLAMGGLTLGFGPAIQPRVFGRAGVLIADSSTPVRQTIGAALVFTMIPKVELGVHAGYNGETENGSDTRSNWWSGGAEASLAF